MYKPHYYKKHVHIYYVGIYLLSLLTIPFNLHQWMLFSPETIQLLGRWKTLSFVAVFCGAATNTVPFQLLFIYHISHIMFYLGIKCIIHYHHNVCVCARACMHARACVRVCLPTMSSLFNCCCSNFFAQCATFRHLH